MKQSASCIKGGTFKNFSCRRLRRLEIPSFNGLPIG
nr:MAG TPA: hypothetical protein [Caudoviricetes sp.]